MLPLGNQTDITSNLKFNGQSQARYVRFYIEYCAISLKDSKLTLPRRHEVRHIVAS